MRKLSILMAVLITGLMLSGCGVKEKLQEKAAEAITEKMLGGNVDIKGDSVTIKGESGEAVTFGGSEWPDSKLVPEFKKGTVSSTMVSGKGFVVVVEDVDKGDAEDYRDEIKKDFTEESFEMNNEGGFMYSGKNGDGVTAAVQYADGSMTVTVSPPEESSK
jgi:hypothetical protein